MCMWPDLTSHLLLLVLSSDYHCVQVRKLRQSPRVSQLAGASIGVAGRSGGFLLYPETGVGGGLILNPRLAGAGPQNFGRHSVKTGKNAEGNVWPQNGSPGSTVGMLSIRNEYIHH